LRDVGSYLEARAKERERSARHATILYEAADHVRVPIPVGPVEDGNLAEMEIPAFPDKLGGLQVSRDPHSHSMVPGGLLVMSSATRFTPGTSLMIRLLTRSNRSYGSRAQSAVIASSEVTARMTTG
jgi:hypothetical protein